MLMRVRSHVRLKAKARATIGILGSALLAVPGWATEPLEPVVITGSYLQGPALSGALPVQVLTRRDIERSGAATTTELLSRVAANQPYQTEAISVGGYGPAGYAGANLRGLGDSNTLVLVNGRRIAQHAAVAYGTGADLLSIPLAAVERVEILKDGASALYGADAVGGVVNFILRSDYSGTEVQLDLGGTTHGGAGRQALSLTSGGALGQSDVRWVGTVAWQKEQRLAASQRPFSRSSYVPGLVNGLSYGTWPATVSNANGDYNPAGCRAPYSVDDPAGSGLCVYDPASQMDLQPASQRLNGTLRLDGKAWDATTRWFAEGMASRATQRTTATAGWVAGFDTASGTYQYPSLPTSSPYYPTAWAAANGVTGPLDLFYWRMADQGGRVDRHVGDQQRWLMGLQGQDGGWQWEGAATTTRHRLASSMQRGYYRYTDLAAMVADGSLNPFGEQTAATQARLNALAVRDGYSVLETRTQGVDLKASRALGRLAGGDAALALGTDIRREKLLSDYSDDAVNCVVSAGLCGGVDLARARTVGALFGELSLPFAPAWSAQLAVRHDRYSIGGKATSPKLALKWQAAADVMWRASVGKGFIAPTLEQLYAPGVLAYAPGGEAPDTLLCADPTVLSYDCGAFGHNQRTSGNAQLQPETSRQFGLGLVLGGTPRWQVSLDAWAIDKRNKIGFVPAGTVFADQSLYESLGYLPRYQPGDVLPDGSTCVSSVCPIKYVDAQYRNLGRQKVTGLDVGGRWRSPATAWGVWSLGLDGTWVQRYATQVSAFSGYVDQAGHYALDRPVPRWRHLLQAGLAQGPWQWTVGHRFVASYVDFNPDPSTLADRRVRPQSLWDLQGAYRYSDSMTLSLGVQNLFGVAPPASRQVNSFQVGFDPHFADPRGRVVSLRSRWSL
ncbi:MAG: TonB-dependent receptor [Burkholderiales bacterium]